MVQQVLTGRRDKGCAAVGLALLAKPVIRPDRSGGGGGVEK